jgi:hypothetical protein
MLTMVMVVKAVAVSVMLRARRKGYRLMERV